MGLFNPGYEEGIEGSQTEIKDTIAQGGALQLYHRAVFSALFSYPEGNRNNGMLLQR
jgi:hypothetical protein